MDYCINEMYENTETFFKVPLHFEIPYVARFEVPYVIPFCPMEFCSGFILIIRPPCIL